MRCSSRFLGLADELSAAGAPPGWAGTAAEAANGNLRQVNDRAEHIVAAVNAARTALITAADEVIALQHLVKDTDWLAQPQSFAIDNRGAVIDLGISANLPSDQLDAVNQERAKVKARVVDRVRTILDRAEDLDEYLAKMFGKIEHVTSPTVAPGRWRLQPRQGLRKAPCTTSYWPSTRCQWPRTE